MAVQHNQVRKRLRMEMLAPEETGIMSLQREVMELKQENKRLRRDICKALPEVVHEMKDIVGQLQLFAKSLQSTCHQLNQTCQRIPQRDTTTLNRRMVTQVANRMPQKQKLVKKIGSIHPPIRTVKTVESVANSSPMQQQRKVTPNSSPHFASGSPTLSASSPRYSPSAKQSPGHGPFSPSQSGTPHSGSSPRPPRYPPSTSNPTLPVSGADNLPLMVSNVTSLSKNHFEAPTSQVPVPVQINSNKPADSQQQDVFELKPGTGVCIPIQGWISTRMQCGSSESKMVRQLMKFLFTEDDLAICSMRGNRLGQPCLDQNIVDAIIWRCMEEFPGRTKGHIGQAISQKLQESRSRKKTQSMKRPLSLSGSLSPDNEGLPEDIMMVLDPPTGTSSEGTPKQNGDEDSDASKKSGNGDVGGGGGGDDVIEVKEDGDAGWR